MGSARRSRARRGGHRRHRRGPHGSSAARSLPVARRRHRVAPRSTTRSARGSRSRPRVCSAARSTSSRSRCPQCSPPGWCSTGWWCGRSSVRVVPGLPPRLQAGPVGLRAYVSQDNVDRWTRTARLPMRLAAHRGRRAAHHRPARHPDERDARRPRGGRPLRAAGSEADDDRRAPRSDGSLLPRLPPAPRRCRRGPGSRSCARATVSWRSPSSSTTSTSPSLPTSPSASAPSPASRSCRPDPARRSDHPPAARGAFLRWPHSTTACGGWECVADRPSTGSTSKPTPPRTASTPAWRPSSPSRWPALSYEEVFTGPEPELLIDLDERTRRARARRPRHLERRRLRPAVPLRPGRAPRVAARAPPAARPVDHHAACAAARPPRRLPRQLVRPRPPRRLPPLPRRRRTGAPHLVLAEVDRPVRGAGARRGRPHPDPRPLQRGAPRLRRERRPARPASSPSAVGAPLPGSSTASRRRTPSRRPCCPAAACRRSLPESASTAPYPCHTPRAMLGPRDLRIASPTTRRREVPRMSAPTTRRRRHRGPDHTFLPSLAGIVDQATADDPGHVMVRVTSPIHPEVDLGLRSLDPGSHPFDVLAGFEAPDDWAVFGLRTTGRARHARPPERRAAAGGEHLPRRSSGPRSVGAALRRRRRRTTRAGRGHHPRPVPARARPAHRTGARPPPPRSGPRCGSIA